MYIYGKCSAFFLGIIFIAGCRDATPLASRQSLAASLLHCKEEFRVGGLSYLIAEKGRISGEYFDAGAEDREMASSQGILAHFIAPLILDRMIRDSSVHEQDSASQWLKARDLNFVPSDYYERDTGRADQMTGRILRIIDKHPHSENYSVEGGFRGKCELRPGEGIKGLFQNLRRISDYFDRCYPEYTAPGDGIYNVFPGWYTRGLRVFFGWNILKFQGQTVLWNCFAEGASTILLIKFMEKRVFIALGYATGCLLSPPDLNRNDLLQSPFAVTLLKELYLQNPEIDYTQPGDSLYTELAQKQGSSYNFIYLHDLLAHARLYRMTGMEGQANALYKVQGRLMKDSLLVRYENKPVLAEIGYVPDNFNAIVPFTLKTSSAIQIFAGGQVRVPHDYRDNTYIYDNVQLFLNDHAGEKANSWLHTHLFQFNYGSKKLENPEELCAFGDPSDSSYIVEARIAWKTLNSVRHAAGRNLLANVLVSDCDLYENWRESMLSWAVAPGENYADEKKYGTLALAGRPGPASAKKLYAIQTGSPPLIDGKTEKEWDRAPWSSIALPYQYTVSTLDNSGRFKALFDNQYLYFLFEITDNCKNRLGIVTTDKCWIEDAGNGLVVWKMNGDTTEYFPSFDDRKRLFLPAGKYFLKYASDKGHSYEHWYGRPPANGIYGASVYAAEN